jgi:dinuclear metal center YbgI/SA1388 family protein
MIKRDKLVSFVFNTIGSEVLEKARCVDEMANGVQVLGASKVSKVCLGVSLNKDFLVEAVKSGADFCIFHHGFDVRTFKSLYPRFSQKRLALIFENKLTIMGLHYALDAHPEFGNNAAIIKKLGAKVGKPLFDDWGFTGVFKNPQDVKALSKKCSSIFSHDVFAVFAGPRKVKKIGVVSGAGKPDAKALAEMEDKGIELFITGEPSESVPHKMKESGINYFAGGHYATEVFGVQELGKKIKLKFKNKLKVEFLDIPNPV